MAVGMADFPSITKHDPVGRDVGGGQTGLDRAGQFITVRTAGVRDLVEQLKALAGSVESDATLKRIVRRASKIVAEEYKTIAERHMATGNLAASVKIFRRQYKNSTGGKAVVEVIGPLQTGPVGTTAAQASGNHAWLVEFGTDRRRPGTKGRRTYINVHQMVNRRMVLHPGVSMNDKQFANAGRGYYFLMGSLYERAGQPAGRPGYSRDFADGPGPRQHPITLKPGETIAPMPGMHIMEDVIEATSSDVLGTLRSELIAAINARS